VAFVFLALTAGSPPRSADPAPVEPWLEITSRSRTVEIHQTDQGTDAFVTLTLTNRLASRVRVEEARLEYRDADRVLRLLPVGSELARSAGGELTNVVEGRGRLEWTAICLTSVPEGATLARVALRLSTRKGSRRLDSSFTVDFDLSIAPEPRLLRLPFEGYWRVTQGHACGTSHRAGGRGGEYAWDFIAAERGGKAQGSIGDGRKNRDSATFGQSVLAPTDGRVIRAVTDVPDNEGLREFPRRSLLEGLQRPEWVFGNFVVLDLGEGAYLLLAHLEKGSIRVEPGQAVRAGDAIARCGNSGNTVMSHLHLQVMDRADPADPEVRGLPARFTSYTEITAPGGGGGKDLFIRRVSSGDPPEGSVVAPFYPDPPERSG
jgi:murein DD-endopeptidase MepM/ murein hydrolase activator NlpD